MNRHITENQMLRLYQLVPDYFESEWMLRRFFELFAKDRPGETDRVVDLFIEEIMKDKPLPKEKEISGIIRMLEAFNLKAIAEASDAEEFKQKIIAHLKAGQLDAPVKPARAYKIKDETILLTINYLEELRKHSEDEFIPKLILFWKMTITDDKDLEEEIIANALANCRVEDGNIVYNPNN